MDALFFFCEDQKKLLQPLIAKRQEEFTANVRTLTEHEKHRIETELKYMEGSSYAYAVMQNFIQEQYHKQLAIRPDDV